VERSGRDGEDGVGPVCAPRAVQDRQGGFGEAAESIAVFLFSRSWTQAQDADAH